MVSVALAWSMPLLSKVHVPFFSMRWGMGRMLPNRQRWMSTKKRNLFSSLTCWTAFLTASSKPMSSDEVTAVDSNSTKLLLPSAISFNR